MINACISCKYVYSTMITEQGANYRCLINPKFRVYGVFDLCRNRCNKFEVLDRIEVGVSNAKNNGNDNKKKK